MAALSVVVWAMALILVHPLPDFGPGAEAAKPSLQERRHQRDQEERLADEAAFTSKVCKTRISTSIRWDSFAVLGRTPDAVGYCDVALSALERICRESLSKVQGRIRHLECGVGRKRTVVISGSTIRYAVSPRRSRDDVDFVYKQLKRGL